MIRSIYKKPPETYLFLSFAKNVSGTHIFSAKSPDSVSTSLTSFLPVSPNGAKAWNANRSSRQYWFKYIVIV